jgi:hypothetical protein
MGRLYFGGAVMAEKKRDKLLRIQFRVRDDMRPRISEMAEKMGVLNAHLNAIAWAIGFRVLSRTVSPELPDHLWDEIAKEAGIEVAKLKDIMA